MRLDCTLFAGSPTISNDVLKQRLKLKATRTNRGKQENNYSIKEEGEKNDFCPLFFSMHEVCMGLDKEKKLWQTGE